VEQLEALARATVDAVTVAPADVDALRERTIRRRRRRRTQLSALAVVVVLMGGLGVWRALEPDDGRAPSIVGTPTRPPVTQAAPVPAVPAPSEPSAIGAVTLDRGRAPMAVVGSAAWVASVSGVDAYDVRTLQRIATIPTDVPVVTMAASADGVWAVSGDDAAGDQRRGGPYTLLRIDPASDRIAFSVVLPFVDEGRRSTWNLRLAAGPGVAWVTFGDVVLEVDAATGEATTISLENRAVGNIAADRDGLWLSIDGGLAPGVAAFGVVYVDAHTHEITVVDGIPRGFMWGIAATPDAAWLVETFADNNGDPALHLVRIDATTHALTPFVVPGIAVVTGDDQVWVQLYESSPDGRNRYSGLVGQVNPTTGRIVRTMHMILGEAPASASSGYTFPPFAVAGGQLWSSYSGLQRTTIPTSASSTTVAPVHR
jgi:hypothetical protein